MLVSVVLVVYNQLALTRACLESLRQTTLPFELCVVDNGSSDGTEPYFRRPPTFATPLRYERNAENVGLIRALNALGVTPRDTIAILEALKSAGALQAELEIM